MCHWILKGNVCVVLHRTVRPLTPAEVHSPAEVEKRRVFDELIERRWGQATTTAKPNDTNQLSYYEDDHEAPRKAPDIEDPVDSKGQLLNQQPAYDTIINAKV